MATTIHTSAHEGDDKTVRGRVDLGENPNALDEDGRTPLHWACAGGHVELVEYLAGLEGARLDGQDDAGWTPLMSAVAANKLAVVKLLLGKGADPRARNQAGQTCLHFHKARPQVLALLLPYYTTAADINSKVGEADKMGNTALHLAAEEGLPELMDCLVAHGADPRTKNADGKDCWDIAGPQGRAELQRLAEECDSK